MRNGVQIGLSALVVVVAAGFVAIQLRSNVPAQTDDGMEGHNHAAMVAGGEQSPVRLSLEDARRIGVTFATAERRSLPQTVQALGTVGYDETGLVTVNPKIEGWIEQLFVDFTGAPISKGQPLMAVYSPMLVSAQEELVLAARLVRDAGEGRARDNARALLESARRRLEYWDIPLDEIRRIEETGEVTRTVTLRAPASGVVVEKNVVEGDRIMPGMTLFRIADLSRVWIEADIFEKDLAMVREGQGVTATFEALPGRSFAARITYVYPTVSMEARTGRIRLELPNPNGALKPGMYAKIALDIPAAQPSLVVPRAAVLSTGMRSLVFVQGSDGALVAREVVPGRTEGREVEILEGLSEGERIVSSAAFLVDAESNLGALTAGMDMTTTPDTMDSRDDPAGAVDHSQHDMPAPMPDTTAAMDHSQHDMTMPDTTPAVDHSGHDMGGSPPDTTRSGAAGR